jgi:hypothetical protein
VATGKPNKKNGKEIWEKGGDDLKERKIGDG